MKISDRIALRDLIKSAIEVFGTNEVAETSGYTVNEINKFMVGYKLNDRVAQDFYDTLAILGARSCRGDNMKTQSQSQRILAWLQSGNTITQLDALRMFSCMRLASRISDLRNAGYNIITQFEEHEGGQHARYSLAAGDGK